MLCNTHLLIDVAIPADVYVVEQCDIKCRRTDMQTDDFSALATYNIYRLDTNVFVVFGASKELPFLHLLSCFAYLQPT